jgi:hypothetical protein
MSKKKEMDCSCADAYCFSKIPESAVAERENRAITKVKLVNTVTGNIKIVDFNSWIKLCDELHCDPATGHKYRLHGQSVIQ